jgi:hypothetical protein
MFSIKEQNIEKHDMGIVLFRQVIPMEKYKDVLDFAQSLRIKALQEDFIYVKDENNHPLYAINRSGHRYSMEDVAISCNHIMDFLKEESAKQKYYDFFKMCEDALYACMLRYVEFFPMMIPCLWWRTQGHIVAYGAGAKFGIHCDNDVNYQPGAEPDQQLAIRNVLGGLIYFNNSVDSTDKIIHNYDYVGGEIYFPYANYKYSPKSGDILMFPSNYLATHRVLECQHGERYAYVGYFAQGSNDISRGVNVRQPSETIDSGQVWMPNIMDDYIKHLQDKGIDIFLEENRYLTEAVKRPMTSHDTNKEINKSVIQ